MLGTLYMFHNLIILSFVQSLSYKERLQFASACQEAQQLMRRKYRPVHLFESTTPGLDRDPHSVRLYHATFPQEPPEIPVHVRLVFSRSPYTTEAGQCWIRFMVACQPPNFVQWQILYDIKAFGGICTHSSIYINIYTYIYVNM